LGIPGEPASVENLPIEKKQVVAALAQPLLTSIDFAGFGDVPCRNLAQPFRRNNRLPVVSDMTICRQRFSLAGGANCFTWTRRDIGGTIAAICWVKKEIPDEKNILSGGSIAPVGKRGACGDNDAEMDRRI
jgi:hypothetical protein